MDSNGIAAGLSGFASRRSSVRSRLAPPPPHTIFLIVSNGLTTIARGLFWSVVSALIRICHSNSDRKASTMATFRRRSGRMNGLVKVAGKQRSKTFDKKTEAKIWAAGLERHLKKPDRYDTSMLQGLTPFLISPVAYNTINQSSQTTTRGVKEWLKSL